MSTERRKEAPAPLSQRELDMLKVLAPVLEGKRSQVEAARLLDVTPRHVRRLLDKIRSGGDEALAHGLRGRASNHQADADLRSRVLKEYRSHYHDFGPTLASWLSASKSDPHRQAKGAHLGSNVYCARPVRWPPLRWSALVPR
jgi:hypothetical protein